jgi:hypothetical protein
MASKFPGISIGEINPTLSRTVLTSSIGRLYCGVIQQQGKDKCPSQGGVESVGTLMAKLASIGTLINAPRQAPNFQPILLACVLIDLNEASVQLVLTVLLGTRNPISFSSLGIYTVVLVPRNFMEQFSAIMVGTARTGQLDPRDPAGTIQFSSFVLNVHDSFHVGPSESSEAPWIGFAQKVILDPLLRLCRPDVRRGFATPLVLSY